MTESAGRAPWIAPLPWVLIAASVTLELTTPAAYSYLSLLSAATPLAALSYSIRWVVAVAVTGALGMIALQIDQGRAYSAHFLVDFAANALIAAVAVFFAVSTQRSTRRLERVQALAEAAQRALLRPLPRRVGSVALAGFYRAADSEALVGGDLYGVRQSPWGTRMILGDVRGKGNGAVATVATTLATFREAAAVQESLADVAERIETALALDSADAHDDELFVTAVLLEFPSDEPVVRLLNRGHPPVLLMDEAGVRPLDVPFALPLGLGAMLGHAAQGEVTHQLAEGDLLVAYSDGITEARDEHDNFYPLTGRLGSNFSGRSAHRASPSRVAEFIEHDVASWAQSLKDDAVVLVLERVS
ncbi:PP2C family protein-serine/threonine phosphatase [Streptacidiphilus jiangxiensis]|uniref:Serine phosphatase RsbU, regulator of sigma subunit n=1 Tax=Streptacidiphilus jiangxiensis TaxID=235985 RepID=A0A1H7N1Q7_STRJI|nr:PP2C family protein-serine/threonine phosphatase [Streptacidiphilus jiangxiensis]SEL17249.1 Serine phosphatase RsbU, regulator of sigma subunit [Streptacidiphilus jiangxiensis]